MAACDACGTTILFGGPDPATPSPALEKAVRLNMAAELAAQPPEALKTP
jgi:hypothetical protein